MYNKKISNYRNVFRGVSLVLSVLTLSLAVSYFASAWTEPSVAPPGGNASAPLNVSFTDQSKEGRIGIGGIFAPLYSLDIRDSIGLGTLRTTGGAILNTGGAPTGLIVQNGNVGIGTTTPATSLHVFTNSGWGEVRTESSDPAGAADYHMKANAREFGVGVGGSAFGLEANKFYIYDQTVGATRMVIDTNGNVGIGTTNPGAKLHVLGISNIDTKADNIFIQGITDVASNNPAIEFRRSKGNSYPGNPVVFDDMLGEVIGEGYDGVSWPEAANIRMSVDGPVAAGKVPARFDFLTRNNSGNYSSRMTIKADGNVGIGTTDPISPLHVFSSTGVGPEIRVQATEPTRSADIHFQSDGREWAIGSAGTSTGNRSNKFFINDQTGGNVDRFVIDSSGNVGIGTPEPSSLLHIQSNDADFTALRITNTKSTPGVWELRSVQTASYGPNNGLAIWGGNQGSEETRMVISKTGNVGIGTVNPATKLEVDGGLRLNTTNPKPSCDVTKRGVFWFTQSPGGTADKVTVCVKRSDNIYEWQDLMRKGSTCDGINILGIICINT